jgi:chaperonin cofactor prefoldin
MLTATMQMKHVKSKNEISAQIQSQTKSFEQLTAEKEQLAGQLEAKSTQLKEMTTKLE